MNWRSVTSSNLDAVAYEASTSTLFIRFNNGTVYAYDGVPTSTHSGLMSAGSHGSYLANHIKGHYPFRKL